MRQSSFPSAGCPVRYLIAVSTNLWAAALPQLSSCGRRAAGLCIGAYLLVSGSQEHMETSSCMLSDI